MTAVGSTIEDLRVVLPHSDKDGMGSDVPTELDTMLNASSVNECDRAWGRFVERYSRILLHTAHARSNGYDDAMDRYAFILQSLKESDFKRLRSYDADSRARFSTWLVIVARRLCVDYHRRRYGTLAGGTQNGDLHREYRRRLADLVSVKLDLASLPDPGAVSPESGVRHDQLLEALAFAVQALEPRDRWLLRLRFHDELPAREIASLMDFPTLFHVYRRVNTVLKDLRASLEAQGVADAQP